MDIRKHIKELLFHHDCVIIPGFGGFVTAYQSSEIQRFKNTIYPPSKSLMFNRRLQNNDGILISHISEKEMLPYAEVQRQVRHFSEKWVRSLENKGMIVFPDIGKLYVNSSGNLIFLPELRKNYLTDTFGLKPISYNPESVTAGAAKIKNLPTDVREKNYAALKRRRWAAAAGVGALVLLLALPQMLMQQYLPEKIRIQELDVIAAFAKKESLEYRREFLRPETENFKRVTPGGIRISDSKKSEITVPLFEKTAENKEFSPKKLEAEVAQKITSKKEEITSAMGNFYIILETSEYISDAIRQKKKLDENHKKVFEVFSKEGKYLVGIPAGNSKGEAENLLKNFYADHADARVIQRN